MYLEDFWCVVAITLQTVFAKARFMNRREFWNKNNSETQEFVNRRLKQYRRPPKISHHQWKTPHWSTSTLIWVISIALERDKKSVCLRWCIATVHCYSLLKFFNFKKWSYDSIKFNAKDVFLSFWHCKICSSLITKWGKPQSFSIYDVLSIYIIYQFTVAARISMKWSERLQFTSRDHKQHLRQKLKQFYPELNCTWHMPNLTYCCPRLYVEVNSSLCIRYILFKCLWKWRSCIFVMFIFWVFASVKIKRH